jgi:hypothetical protein
MLDLTWVIRGGTSRRGVSKKGCEQNNSPQTSGEERRRKVFGEAVGVKRDELKW